MKFKVDYNLFLIPDEYEEPINQMHVVFTFMHEKQKEAYFAKD